MLIQTRSQQNKNELSLSQTEPQITFNIILSEELQSTDVQADIETAETENCQLNEQICLTQVRQNNDEKR